MNNVVNIKRTEDCSDLFKKNYDFFNYMENYERSIMSTLESVYDKNMGGRIFHEMISKERKSNSWIFYAVSCMALGILSFVFAIVNQKVWLAPLAIVAPIASVYLWRAYKSPENSKTMVLGRVFHKLLNQNILESDYLPALKSSISEEAMIELIKKYEKNIPISEVLEHTRAYFHDFREYKARQIYININNKK